MIRGLLLLMTAVFFAFFIYHYLPEITGDQGSLASLVNTLFSFR